MTDTEPTPPSVLPSETIEAVRQLDEPELRAVIDFVQQRYVAVQSDITDKIRAHPGEEIVRMERKDGYTAVVKRQPCGRNCSNCPHGPFLYHVWEDRGVGEKPDLRWRYLGTVHQE